ncbi:MAG: curli assembly protein CsgF [Pseudomonadota bacterium]
MSQGKPSIGRFFAPVTFVAILTILGSGTVGASELVYKPINPAFGGNPFNAAYLLGTADRQNKFDNRAYGQSARSSVNSATANSLTRSLESRLGTPLAAQATNKILGESFRDSGKFVAGDQTITYLHGVENILVQVQNNATGEVTDFSVPATR